VSVLDGITVEYVVVHAELPTTILLLDQDYWRAPHIVGMLNQVPVKKILYLSAYLLLRA